MPNLYLHPTSTKFGTGICSFFRIECPVLEVNSNTAFASSPVVNGRTNTIHTVASSSVLFGLCRKLRSGATRSRLVRRRSVRTSSVPWCADPDLVSARWINFAWRPRLRTPAPTRSARPELWAGKGRPGLDPGRAWKSEKVGLVGLGMDGYSKSTCR